jgi:hypothetical protein
MVCVSTQAQNRGFGLPVTIPIVLNGNFCEIRSNHFHAGIDIKTNGTTGLPVFSIDNGCVSRISVSSTGYGNAIYVEHPSGYTSVYGHLERFSPAIEKWVKEQQYSQERFEVNLEPEAYLFNVKKGEQIAISGNTGSSAGPHLHFEVRKTADQHPVNPLLNGYVIKDNSKPVAENLYIYALSVDGHVKGSNKKQRFSLVSQNGTFKIKEVIEPIPVWGAIGFGVEATDYLDGNWSKCGIYKLELWVDSLLINSFAFDELAYERMRHLNSHIDYEESVVNNRKVQKAYIDPGNLLSIYSNTVNRGICNFDDGKKHRVRILLFDAALNKSEVTFSVQSTKPASFPEKKFTALFRFDRKNKFENDEVELVIPEETLFTDLKFEYNKLPKSKGIYSAIHQLHFNTVPLGKYATIKINADMVPDDLKDKALICQLNTATGSMVNLGGEYSMGWIKTETRTLGNMCIAIDSVAPKITALSFGEKNTFNDPGQLRFKITDNLSGIKSYNGYIDDEWVLFEYDAKSNTIRYKFDEHIPKGKKHQIKLIVEDSKANAKEYSNTFYY